MNTETAHGPDEAVVVFARWVGQNGKKTNATTEAGPRAHIYSSSIPPAEPIRPGTRVRILATSPAWYTTYVGDNEMYDAYDAHVVGEVTGVAGWKGRKIVLQIANECAINPIKTVRLRIPFAPNVTVDMQDVHVPLGHHEAHETDLNTTSVVRTSSGDFQCGARTCCPPWRKLVGENFLQEPMLEDVGDRTGADGGHAKMQVRLTSWHEIAMTKSRTD
ncbi:hypothetical protein K466DRAFT_598195 [Polyporus arcularius HHB13444]|uniref:Uncharacterized protein n=1 Tax=Polyporus arcularius HHB13444 TaxID=1314778 RepID=A0A5C3PGR1_9APHY|nr:hypothetical protein K466DRAFT_598195 [Polyporus arcularius HHB13444]